MDRSKVRALLESVQGGARSVDEALDALSASAVSRLPYATVDTHRALRTGVPEVVYGAGKTAEQIAGIFERLLAAEQDALATRVDSEKAEAIVARLAPRAVEWHPRARVLVARARMPEPGVGRIGVVDAGTSDLPVSDEVAVVAEALGNVVHRIHDCGIAGVHRILGRVDELRACRVVVVVAGMDGALPGLVSGLVAVPVIAVPTSVGYGASFGGLAALLTMLNACAPGVSVVNIDNGFGAAYQASLINRASAVAEGARTGLA